MRNILLIGCGKMGSALLGALLDYKENFNITIIDPNKESIEKKLINQQVSAISHIKDYKESIPDIIIFAVKPQILSKVIQDYTEFSNNGVLFISIAAGKSIEYFSKNLGNEEAIVRIMPNIPILIKSGVSTGYTNNFLQEKQKQFIESLFVSFGKFVWLEDEKQIDVVTAISGSGPAYLFHFIESLTSASIKLGLPEDISKTIALETIFGSAKMAKESNMSVLELREQVTSPKGTTEAALGVLMNELDDLILRTAKKAKKRSEELS